QDKKNAPVVSVPSGNFGNICAGILAQQSGLPIRHFIAACNVNDIVSEYLGTEILKPKQAVPTLSNAMDVGNPSNFIRILEIFQHHFPELKSHLSSSCVSDEETLATIKEVYQGYNYLLDPHGAVGYLALKRYLENHLGEKGIFLETAHPVKFPEAVEKATGETVELPASLAELMQKEKKSVLIDNDFDQLKSFLLQ
ncbi:MAG: threonine synthase, partial [Bacteroidetes bacterium]|nr:threonine synthase [Bacteroidota bacterium]